MHQIENLLNQVNAITTRYKKINEITGENFNVFRILKLESSEVRMHSAFIAELLNRHGSHGQKDSFLKLFVQSFCFKGNLIETEFCRVKVEESIGTISEDRTQGGRIDIVVTDTRNNHQIIIENKIYAGDQDHQLTRYYNYSENADIIYLTLYGKPPSNESKGEMKDGIHYKSYSYEEHILSWLELCRKEVAIYPVVREAITHYINLIKYLTNQTLNRNMKEELSDLMSNNIEASFAIANNLNNACDKISKGFGINLENACQDIGLSCSYKVSFKENFSGIWICRPEWKYFNIGFQFRNWDKNLVYGIVKKGQLKDISLHSDIVNKISTIPQNMSKEFSHWPWCRKVEDPYDNWHLLPAWKAIVDKRMKDNIMEKVKYLLEITKDLEL